MAQLLTGRLRFKVRDMSAIVANFRAEDARLQSAARRRVKDAGKMFLDLVRATVAYDTGRMQRLVKVTYSRGGLAWSGGWDAADFEAEDEPFYPPYVEVGTYTQAAQPSIVPAWMIVQSGLKDALAGDMRRSVNRRAR